MHAELAYAIKQHSIVFCDYSTLEGRSRNAALHLLKRIKFRRIVLDECQMIRSSATQVAKVCAGLITDHRWMVSGTPLYTGIQDLNGILAFLRTWPFSQSDLTDGFFEHKIGTPWTFGDNTALFLVRQLLSTVMMRHTKSQNFIDPETGLTSPILDLPKSHSTIQAVRLPPNHQFVNGFIEHHCRLEVRSTHAQPRSLHSKRAYAAHTFPHFPTLTCVLLSRIASFLVIRWRGNSTSGHGTPPRGSSYRRSSFPPTPRLPLRSTK